VPSVADEVRLVIDETSFDFREMTADRLGVLLDLFSDTLIGLRRDDLMVWQPPMFEATLCLEDQGLYDYLWSGPGIDADPEAKRRFKSLIDKCLEWDASYPEYDEVEISHARPALALSVAFAATAARNGHDVASLVFPDSRRRGFVETAAGTDRYELFFFADESETPPFWRRIYEFENIIEDNFFTLTNRAFPNLVFHPDLTFRRFHGSYRELRGQVVHHLGILNDHFIREYRTAAASGRVSDIAQIFGAHGVGGISAESVRTRANARAMRQRQVEFEGENVCCEWHTKIRPDVNRIHFAFGGRLGDKVLIGIFVDHLDLE
jgi:hypothetical protein